MVKNGTSGSASFPPIQGVDTTKGVAMTGGTAESYHQVLSMFCKDAEDRIQKFRFFLFESMSNGNGKFHEKHLLSFITQIHALKSVSATIGASEVSVEASRLEEAGSKKELVFILDNLADFVEHLSGLVKNIHASLDLRSGKDAAKSRGLGFFGNLFAKQKSDKSSAKGGHSELLPVFHKLLEALESQNVLEIDKILEDSGKKPLDPKTKEILESISDQVLMAEFGSAKITVSDFLNSNK